MEAHRVMRALIPDRLTRIAARIIGVSESYITKWRREPASEANPNGTGLDSPLDRVDRLFDFTLAHSPEKLPLLRDRYPARFDQILSHIAQQPISQVELEVKLSGCMRDVNELLASILEGSGDLRCQWEGVKSRIEELVRRKEQGK